MRNLSLLFVAGVTMAVAGCSGSAQTRDVQPPASAESRAARPAEPEGPSPHVRKTEVGGRLTASEQKYAAIEGAKLKAYVEDMAAIARRYRDNGHPQYWGRIIGSEADAETARWVQQKFESLKMTDVHQQPIDLAPQWMAKRWSVAASASGKTLELSTAQPTYNAVGTPAGGMDLEAVYVGLGSDADIALSRDVKGKAVFFYSTDLTSRHVGVADNAIKRLGERGAAAIFVIQGIPGNIRTQFYPVQSPVPTFTLGQRDGLAMRDLIGANAAGPAPRVRLVLEVENVPNLKSSTVWGTLPGTTAETVFIVAHRDGWFEGANDNASGVAVMAVLAEYFAKMTPAQRRRNITFLGTTGHHNNGINSGAYFGEHKELFEKAALIINCEHIGAKDTGHYNIRMSNQPAPSSWYATGPVLGNIVTNALDAFGVATTTESGARPGGEIGRYFQYAPSVQVMSGGYVWHSDAETPDTISTTGIEAVTRAYAKIVADVNATDIKALRSVESTQ